MKYVVNIAENVIDCESGSQMKILLQQAM